MILNNQAGQAMVEYVLILIFSVTLLFLARGVFTSLNNFMTSYVGGYFKCLMVQGELPALSVADSDLSKHTSAGYKCSISYDPSTVAGGNTGGGVKNIGTTKPISTVKGSTKETASRRGGSTAKSSLKSKKSPTSSSGGGDDDNRLSSNIRNRSDAYSSADSESYDEGSVQSVSMSGRRSDGPPEKTRLITGKQADDLLKNSRGGLKRQNTTRQIALADENRPGPRRNKLNPPTRAVAAASDDADDNFTLGNFFKWVMIAGIIILLLVFFGGQFLNYSNSKNE